MSVESATSQRPARGPYRKGLQKRQEVVAAATEVFAEVGYHRGSLRTIGDRVGMSSASLIQYFGSKEALLAAVLEEWSDATHRRGAQHLSGLAWISSMREVMRYHVQHRQLIDLFITLAAEATDPNHPAHEFMLNRYMGTMDDFKIKLHQAIADGDLQPMAPDRLEYEVRTFFAVMDGLELQWLLDPQVDLTGLFDQFLGETLDRWAQAPT